MKGKMKLKLACFACLSIVLCLIPLCQSIDCKEKKELSDGISDSSNSNVPYSSCWIIDVAENMYIRLKIKEMNLASGFDCSLTFVKVTEIGTDEEYKFCSKDGSIWKTIIAFRNVKITFSNHGYRSSYRFSSFHVTYHIEDLMCAQRNNFRCSIHSCIHEDKVCDGVKDCENGIDENECGGSVLAVKGINTARKNTITWLKNQRSSSSDWGNNTHRAITALYLAGKDSFEGQNSEEELIAEQLELRTLNALIRDFTDPMTVSELSTFVNALTLTCYNTRSFYGLDLVKILSDRVTTTKIPSPGAYLTLCSYNWKFTATDVEKVLELLDELSGYRFHLDVQAMTMLALTCMKNEVKEFTDIEGALDAYNKMIEIFISAQLTDGSFGNVYTTALVTQALIACDQEKNKQWDLTSTVNYLMKHLNSSIDFFSAYLALPVFGGRSFADIKAINCENNFRKQKEDRDISDEKSKLGATTLIRYSLYVGDRKEIIHTILLRMPVKSSAYAVMKAAQVEDPKFKYLHRVVSDHLYVYKLADIPNDPEVGKFWLFYKGDKSINVEVQEQFESPDKVILEDEAHLIMWYRTVYI